MSEVTRKRFEEVEKARKRVEKQRKELWREYPERTLEEARREERETKKRLLREQIKAAKATMERLRRTTDLLHEIHVQLTDALKYAYEPKWGDPIIEVRSDVEAHQLKLKSLRSDWETLLKKLEEEYKK